MGIQKRFSGNVWEMSRKAVGEICWNLVDNLARKIVNETQNVPPIKKSDASSFEGRRFASNVLKVGVITASHE